MKKTFFQASALGLLVPTLLGAQTKATSTIENYLPNVSGFANIRYFYDGTDDSNGFDIRRARLDVRGKPISRLGYRLQVDFANTPKILDAYLHYKVNKYLHFQVGEFKIPFSLENKYGPLDLETIENSLVISRLCNYSDVSGIKSNGRDIGISLSGGIARREGIDVLHYSFGVFNGNGINTKDNNHTKDFSSRIDISPVKHFILSGSYYKGTYGEQGEAHNRERAGGGIQWKDKRWLIRSEYLYGKTGGKESEGVYAVAGYHFTPQFQFLLKYDYFQEDKTDNDTREQQYGAGITYRPNRFLRVQANYSYKIPSTGQNDNLVAAQFFVIF